MNTPLDNAEYQYFIFHSSTNQVSSGWEYREDARDALADLPIDLQATGRVLTRRGVNNALKAAVADDEVVIDATLTTTTTAAPVTVTVVPYHCTELAYQCCNCSDDPEWKTGNVVVLPSEEIVLICWAWPIAVTAKGGDLHQCENGAAGIAEIDNGRFASAARIAIAEAEARGWPIHKV